MSKEVAEARNKHFCLFRQILSLNFSRISCNPGVLNRLLQSSDPALTEMRPTIRKKFKSFFKQTLDMLLRMEAPETRETESSEYEDDYDELSNNEKNLFSQFGN